MLLTLQQCCSLCNNTYHPVICEGWHFTRTWKTL
jgi:hypothetical protein